MRLSVVQNPYISAADLNDDLKTISQWAHQLKMEFNPDPKQVTEMLFSQKKVRFILFLSFNDTEVTKVNIQKHLSLTFDKNLLSEKHTNEKIKTAQKGVAPIKHF